MNRTLHLVGRSAALFTSASVVLAATGWLYLIQPRHALPGPAIGDALPLDELSRRSAVPLLVFLVVWGTAGLLLGLLARASNAERLTAALLLALGIGFWLYVSEAASLVVVRQIPAHEALRAAGASRPVYVAAALAGLGGALFGRVRACVRSRAPLVLAWFVAVAGVLDVLAGITPQHKGSLFAALAPQAVHPLANALVAPIGLLLVLVARGLARRKRRAWWLAVVLLGGSTALHVLHGFNYGAIVTGLVLLAIIARRRAFDAAGDPTMQPRLIARAFLWLAAIYGFGVAALWVNRVMADQPYTLGFALRETSAALVGLNVRGSAHLTGAFGEWFPIAVLILGAVAAGSLLIGWLAPWRHRVRQLARERALARALVVAWAEDTLAPFVLRADKSYFFGADAFVAYKVVGGVAIVSGDPIGRPNAFDDLIRRFVAFAHARDWRIAILGASERCLQLYRAHGLHALYHGDEAIVDPATFSLEGRPIRKVRQSVHRLERAGYRAEVLRPREIGSALRMQLEEILRAWRGDEPERGFVMALDALFRLEDEDAVFVVARGPDGKPSGFLHFAVCPRASALSLSSMPRLRDTPNGFNEWLVCEAVDWARAHGFRCISLNFAPFAALLAPEAELSGLQRLERRALLQLKGRFQLDNLLLFNRKFFPQWQRRFVVYERRLDLPRVGIAALAAEAYLPLSGRGRR